MKKSILTGTLIITTIGLLSKAIGILFRIPITYLIGDYGMGIYYFALVLFGPIIAIINAPSVAIARLVSETHALNQTLEKEKILKVATKYLLSIGVAISILMLIIGPFLIRTIWTDEILYPFLSLVPAPIFLSLITVLRGYYQGQQQMHALSIQQFTDGISRVIVGVLLTLVLLSHGIEVATIGATFGTTAGAIFSYIFILIYHKGHHEQLSIELKKEEDHRIRKKIFDIALPITISALGVTLMRLVDGIFITNRLLNIGYSSSDVLKLSGVLNSVNTLMSIPLVIATSISINSLPNIISAAVHGSTYVASRIRTTVIMFVSIALPCGVGLFVAGKRVFNIIFFNISTDHYLIELQSVGLVFIMINLGLVSILQAKKLERLPVNHMYIGILIKLVLSFILLGIPAINIHGTAISTIIAYSAVVFLNLKSCLKGHIIVDLKYMVIVPVISSCIMGILVKLTLSLSDSHLVTILAVVLGTGIYAILMILFKVIALKDIPIVKRFIL